MSMKNPIGWIELPALDLDRAEKFYSDYLGSKFERQKEMNGCTMSWFVPMNMESYGSAMTLMKGENYQPTIDGPLLYFSAPGETVEAGLQKAEEMGIEVLIPKMFIGEHGFFAVLKDSEGNRFAIHSMKG